MISLSYEYKNETGGESRKVGELRPVFELEAWPEPMALSPGTSQTFVWAKTKNDPGLY